MFPKRIYWFAHYNLDGPCTRYRGKYLLEELSKEHKIASTFIVPSYTPSDIARFFWAVFKALFRSKNDLLVIQKVHTLGIYARVLKMLVAVRPKNTLYDIDDAYYINHPPQTIDYFLRKCQFTIAGSEALLDYAKQRGSKSAAKLSSPIIAHNFRTISASQPLTLAWIGFYNFHRDSLEQLIFPGLDQITFPVKLLLLGVDKEIHQKEIKTRFKNSNFVTVEIPEGINWRDENEVYQILSRGNLGLSPLLNTPMNEAKSAFKLKQYLSCGMPCISSPLGENTLVLESGKTGFFASTAQDFLNQINHYHALPSARKEQMSRHCLDTAKKYEIAQYAKRFLSTLSQLK